MEQTKEATPIPVTEQEWRWIISGITPNLIIPEPSNPNQTFDVTDRLLKAIKEYLVEGDLFCDHSVGICMCGSIDTVRLITDILDDKYRCPDCLGDGWIWVETVVDVRTGCETERYNECTLCATKGYLPRAYLDGHA